METSECFIFGKMCACLAVLGNIGKSNSPSILDLIICPLGYFALIIFIVGCTFYRWEDTAMKVPVHAESATAQFSNSISFTFFLFLKRYYYVHMYFKCQCSLYHLGLLYYVFDYLPRLFFIISSIGMPCCFAIPPIGSPRVASLL